MEVTDTRQISATGYGIRFESIGGLGANLAGKVLAESCVLHMDLNAAQFSSYGSEKKGSPVTTYVRLMPGSKSIRVTEPIDEPELIAVFHEALLRDGGCLVGLKPGGVLVVNTARSPREVWEQTGLANVTIVCVNAQQIAIEEHTRSNTAMLGTVCRAVGFLEPDAVKMSLEETFGRKYAELVHANLVTFDRGYADATMETFAEAPITHVVRRGGNRPRIGPRQIGGVIVEPGNSVQKDLSASRQGFVPALNLEACIHCAACDQTCPDYCFVWEQREDAKGRRYMYLVGIDYQYCKGCMKCVEACPTTALEKEREIDTYVEAHRVAHAF